MLVGLSIRDIVTIERLDLSFSGGLSVLTGETGAGKSILLDALGLAVGARADSGLVRRGAARASATAVFQLRDGERARALLGEAGLDDDAADEDGALLLRRVLGADGRGRAFVNDRPVGVAALRAIGGALVEIQGQFEARGLLDPATHRRFLDEYAGHGPLLDAAARAHADWNAAAAALEAGRAGREESRAREAELRETARELDALDPRPGEVEGLEERRGGAGQRRRAGRGDGQGDGGNRRRGRGRGGGRPGGAPARPRGGAGRRAPRRGAGGAGPGLAELQAASAELGALAGEVEADSGRLEALEDRLHALRAAARARGVAAGGLPALRAEVASLLAALEAEGGGLAALEARAARCRAAWEAAARKLSRSRAGAAARLDAAVARELPPLRLGGARFATVVEPLDEARWTAEGRDRVGFRVAANPGEREGPLNRVASGGELSRLLLALRVALAWANPLPTLVFDEVDSGVGGAVAAAVGERLSRLGGRLQVLVVTHSPQVAARGGAHWRIDKTGAGGRVATVATALDAGARREEIARMLAGTEVTPEARAAADSLLNAAPGA